MDGEKRKPIFNVLDLWARLLSSSCWWFYWRCGLASCGGVFEIAEKTDRFHGLATILTAIQIFNHLMTVAVIRQVIHIIITTAAGVRTTPLMAVIAAVATAAGMAGTDNWQRRSV